MCRARRTLSTGWTISSPPPSIPTRSRGIRPLEASRPPPSQKRNQGQPRRRKLMLKCARVYCLASLV
eukprot:9494582-Pyramimonas_sp.AAC.1